MYDLDLLKASVNLVDVIKYDEPLRELGRGKWEGEKHDSLKVGEDVQLWNWFSRGRGGSVIYWAMYYHDYSFVNALNYIQQFSTSGGYAPVYTSSRTDAPVAKYDNQVAELHHAELSRSAEGIEWWNSQGITMDAMQEWKLGWVNEHYFSAINGCSKAAVIPYYDNENNLANVWCRLVPGQSKRYLPYETHHKMSMFAPQFIGDDVVVVEGAKKAIVLWQFGFLSCAINGFNNFRACGGEELFDGVKKFYLCLDPGLKGPDGKPIHPSQLRWVQQQAMKSDIRIVELTMKPDDYILKYGKDKFYNALSNARQLKC